MGKDIIEVCAILLLIALFTGLFILCIKPKPHEVFVDTHIEIMREGRRLCVTDRDSGAAYHFIIARTRHKEQQLKTLIISDYYTLYCQGATLVITEEKRKITIRIH